MLLANQHTVGCAYLVDTVDQKQIPMGKDVLVCWHLVHNCLHLSPYVVNFYFSDKTIY